MRLLIRSVSTQLSSISPRYPHLSHAGNLRPALRASLPRTLHWPTACYATAPGVGLQQTFHSRAKQRCPRSALTPAAAAPRLVSGRDGFGDLPTLSCSFTAWHDPPERQSLLLPFLLLRSVIILLVLLLSPACHPPHQPLAAPTLPVPAISPLLMWPIRGLRGRLSLRVAPCWHGCKHMGSCV